MPSKLKAIDPVVGLCILFGFLMLSFTNLALLFREKVQEPLPTYVTDPIVIPYNNLVEPLQDAVFELIPWFLRTSWFIVVIWTVVALVVTYPIRIIRSRSRVNGSDSSD